MHIRDKSEKFDGGLTSVQMKNKSVRCMTVLIYPRYDAQVGAGGNLARYYVDHHNEERERRRG